MDKSSLRDQLKSKRNALNRKFFLTKSLSISRRVAKLLKNKKTIASFSPLPGEPDPNKLLKNAVYPRVSGDRLIMCKPLLSFKKGYKGIKEPFSRYIKVSPHRLEAVIVPGLGFDKRGYRVGYGKGFYDRFLKKTKAMKVGVSYSCCIVDKIPIDNHDIPVDVIVHEKGTIICKPRRWV